MSIRGKTILVVVLLLAASYVLLGWLLTARIRSDFARLEAREARRNLERVDESVGAMVEGLCSRVADWAVWDDAYDFMADGDRRFVESNVVEATFTGSKIDLMLFYGRDGALKLGQAYDAAARMDAPLPAALLASRFAPGSPLLPRGDADAPAGGVLVGEGHAPLVFCARPILSSAGTGPARGTFVMGIWLDGARQEALRRLTRLSLDFAARPGPLPPGAPGRLVPVSDDLLEGYTSVADPGGRGSLEIRAALPREIHREAGRTVEAVLAALTAVGLAFGLATALLLERLVLRRLADMSRTVTGITGAFEFGRRVDDSGTDEISRLGSAVNGLLSAAEQAITFVGSSDGKRNP
jgi:sensor domain CHASE-containing protein